MIEQSPFQDQTVVSKRNLGANPNVRAQLGTNPRTAVLLQQLPALLQQIGQVEGVESDPFAAFNILGGAVRSAQAKDIEDLLAGLAGNTEDGMRDLSALLGKTAQVTQVQETVRRNKAQEQLAILDRQLRVLPQLAQASQRPQINRPFANAINTGDPFAGVLDAITRIVGRGKVRQTEKQIEADRSPDSLLQKLTESQGPKDAPAEDGTGEPEATGNEKLVADLKAAEDPVARGKILVDQNIETKEITYTSPADNGTTFTTYAIPDGLPTPKTEAEAQQIGIQTTQRFDERKTFDQIARSGGGPREGMSPELAELAKQLEGRGVRKEGEPKFSMGGRLGIGDLVRQARKDGFGSPSQPKETPDAASSFITGGITKGLPTGDQLQALLQALNQSRSAK